MKIVLIGMRASGKTMLGKSLATKINADFFDLDHIFEFNQKQTIKEFIIDNSFTKFREKETKILTEQIKNINSNLEVIATGGGIIEKKENINLLKKHYPIIFIDRDINDIITTLTQDTTRPSLTGNSLAEESSDIYKKRLPRYRVVADYTFSYSDTTEDWQSVTQRFLAVTKKIMAQNN